MRSHTHTLLGAPVVAIVQSLILPAAALKQHSYPLYWFPESINFSLSPSSDSSLTASEMLQVTSGRDIFLNVQ